MANLVDMADMKHRVAATEALLAAAAQDGQERNARLVDFLERVEKNLLQKQEQKMYQCLVVKVILLQLIL